jgi:hypothetical protein
MPQLLTFISVDWIKPLWKELLRIRDDRTQELARIGDIFGNPLELAKYYIEPDCQHHNPADYNEDEPISLVRSPVFKTINSFFSGEFAPKKDGRTQMFILSDAGMGKTSLLMMLKLAHLTAFWPQQYECVLLRLGSDSLDKIANIQNQNCTILLLDALDEDPKAWGRIEWRLRELLNATENFKRVIISCRTQFFPEGATDPFGLPGRLVVEPFVCPVIYYGVNRID